MTGHAPQLTAHSSRFTFHVSRFTFGFQLSAPCGFGVDHHAKADKNVRARALGSGKCKRVKVPLWRS